MAVWAVAAVLGLAGPNAPRLVRQFGASEWGNARYGKVELVLGGRIARVTAPGGGVRHLDLASRAEVPAPAEARLVGPGDKEERFQLVGPAGEVIQTFREPWTYTGRGSWELSPGGKYLRTGANSSAIIWRVADGARVAAVKDISPYYARLFRGDEFIYLGPEPDGTGRKPKHLTRVDLITGKELPRIELGADDCAGDWALADGGRVAVGPSEVGILRIDLDEKRALPPIALTCRSFDPVAFSPDGKRLAVARRRQGDLVVLDYPAGTQRLRVPLKLPREAYLEQAAFSATGDRICVAARAPALLIEFDAATGAEVRRDDFDGPRPADSEPVAFAGPAGASGVVTVAYTGRVRLIDLATRAERRGELPPGRPHGARMLPGGAVLGVMTKNADEVSRLHFCDLAAPEWKWVSTEPLPGSQYTFDAPGGGLAAVFHHGREPLSLAVYEAATGVRRHLIPDRRREGLDFDLATGGYKSAKPFGPPGPLPSADGRYEFEGRYEGFSIAARADGRVVADEVSDGAYFPSQLWADTHRTFLPAPRGHLAALVVPEVNGRGGSHPPPRPVRLFDARTWLSVAKVIPAGDEWGFTGDGRYFVSYGRGLAKVFDVSRVGSPSPPPLTEAERRAAWAALALDADPAPPAGAAGAGR